MDASSKCSIAAAAASVGFALRSSGDMLPLRRFKLPSELGVKMPGRGRDADASSAAAGNIEEGQSSFVERHRSDRGRSLSCEKK